MPYSASEGRSLRLVADVVSGASAGHHHLIAACQTSSARDVLLTTRCQFFLGALPLARSSDSRVRRSDISQSSLTKAGHQEDSDTRPQHTSSYCLPRILLKDAPSLHGLQHAIGMAVTLSPCVSDSPDHLLRSVVALCC